jgi:ribonuclease Y
MDNVILLYSGIIVVAGLSFLLGFHCSRRIGKGKLISAEERAERIIEDAKREAETYKREAILEAKDEWYKAKMEFERETRNDRWELEQLEKKLADRESNIERKGDLLARREKEIVKREKQTSQREKTLKAKEGYYNKLIEEENAKLEQIAGMTTEAAKARLMSNIEAQARHEAAQLIRDIKAHAAEVADREAKEIITRSIQRCATDHVVESTVSVVSLPNDEMKGRIIGREGRNIRAFETATGVEVIIDDTPEAVTLSGFDPVRREIARVALERLVSNGRIHPTRIEEVVTKTHEELTEVIKSIGEELVLEVGVPGIHAELIKLLGRLRYRTSYGQNVLQHSKEVAIIAGLMAGELGFDVSLAKRAGLLHDIGKAVDHSIEGSHVEIGAELASRYGEPSEVVNAIAAHHEDSEAQTPLAVLIQAADAISGSRPGARRETLEAYIQRLQKLEAIANTFHGVEKAYAIQAGREIRIIVEPDELTDLQASELASEVAKKIQGELKYPGQIKVTVIRETRTVDYAK